MTQPATPHALARRAQNDSIHTLYEDTLVPVREIARLVGVTERNIYALVRRLGCRPRVRLASGGGRRIVPPGTAAGLDAAAVREAVQRCIDAVEQAGRLADDSRAAKAKNAALRQDRKAARAQTRVLALLAQTVRDLAAVTHGRVKHAQREAGANKAKPKRRPRAIWTPMPPPVRGTEF